MVVLFEYLFVCYLCNLWKDNLACLSHVLFINEYIDIYYHRLFLFSLGLRSHYIVLAGLELLCGSGWYQIRLLNAGIIGMGYYFRIKIHILKCLLSTFMVLCNHHLYYVFSPLLLKETIIQSTCHLSSLQALIYFFMYLYS